MKEKPEYFQVKEVLKLKKGKCSIFLMKKINYNTLSAVRAVARKLGISERRIGYAGNKDKRAVTEQYISIQNWSKKSFSLKDIELKYIGEGGRIKLGDLEGNKFKIKAKVKGRSDFFVNYFGEQRFGISNVEVGRKIVKGKEVEERDKKKLRFCFNAYQSWLFNEVLKRYLKKYDNFSKKGYVFLKKKIRNFKVPLVNFDTELKGEIGKLYKEVLDEEKVELEDFLVRRMSFLVSDTVFRDIIVNVKDFKKKGDFIEFYLPKGAYATVFLAKILV